MSTVRLHRKGDALTHYSDYTSRDMVDSLLYGVSLDTPDDIKNLERKLDKLAHLVSLTVPQETLVQLMEEVGYERV